MLVLSQEADPTPAELPNLSELQRAKQTAAIINDRAQTIYDDVQAYVNAGQMQGDATSRANTLREAAGQLSIAFNAPKLPTDLGVKAGRVRVAYENLSQNYLNEPWVEQNNYEPMKDIKEGLSLVNVYIAKFERLPAPAPGAPVT